MENQKRARYQSDYHNQGLAFAPLVCSSLGQLGPLFQHAAKKQLSANVLEKTCLGSQTADQATFRILRSFLYLQALDKILAAIVEGVTESLTPGMIYGPSF